MNVNLVPINTNPLVSWLGGNNWLLTNVGSHLKDVGYAPYSPGAAGSLLAIHAQNGLTDKDTPSNDTTTSSVTVSFGASVLGAANENVTTVHASTLYIAGGPVAGTNNTIQNSWGLWNAGKTRLDDVLAVCSIGNAFQIGSASNDATWASLFNSNGCLIWGIESAAAGIINGSAANSAWIGTRSNTPFYLLYGEQIAATISNDGLTVHRDFAANNVYANRVLVNTNDSVKDLYEVIQSQESEIQTLRACIEQMKTDLGMN